MRFFLHMSENCCTFATDLTTNSNVNNLQLTKRIFFKLLNEISPNSKAKHLQLAKKYAEKFAYIDYFYYLCSGFLR